MRFSKLDLRMLLTPCTEELTNCSSLAAAAADLKVMSVENSIETDISENANFAFDTRQQIAGNTRREGITASRVGMHLPGRLLREQGD